MKRSRQISRPTVDVFFGDVRVKACYYQCRECGRQISSEEYYLYGKCSNCRWL